MYSSLIKLSKFIELESRRNYDNKAVVGGLAKVLPNWTQEAKNEGVPDEMINLVQRSLMQYEEANIEERAEIINSLDTQIKSKLAIKTNKSINHSSEKHELSKNEWF